jgi:2-hydroxy-3-oxopropionate reductase
MTAVGFIGLGIMGGPMATNLVRAGFDVVGFNRTPAKVEALVHAGGRAARSVSETVRGADVVVTMLPDSPDVLDVVLGDGGVLDNAPEGTLLIDFSTIRPDAARAVARACSVRGVSTLDAPVSGGEAGAVSANLSIMVGGLAETVEAARPVLDAVGGTVVHVGPSGSGQTVKAANQLIVAGTIGLIAEALVFLEAHQVDLRTAMNVLAGGLAGSAVLERKGAAMIAREFTPGFRAELHHKDLGILAAAAREAGVATPLGSMVSQLMAALTAQGSGHLDHGALISVVEQLSGR